MKLTYEAAASIQALHRGRRDRKRCSRLRTEKARVEGILAKAFGRGAAKTKARCFKGLRMEMMASRIQKLWRQRVARVKAGKTLALLKAQQARVRAFMRRVLGDTAVKVLYAWADWADETYWRKMDMAWCVQ